MSGTDPYAMVFSGDAADSQSALSGVDPLVGRTLNGRFRIVAAIEKGAMGAVYRAIQEPLNRSVAIKILDGNSGAGADQMFQQRFLVESALAAKLTHPNTVRVLDYGCTSDSILYLAMEYLEGESLAQVLKRGPISWRRVVAIAQQIARAFREAHQLGVVHRDLKPGNVMLVSVDDDVEHVKVLDFGLVKSFVEGYELEGRVPTQHGMLMGTPEYMAPEQGDKNRADPRSDIYSLGCVMFEALTGAPPFQGPQALQVILKHVHEPVPSLVISQSLEALPEGLEAIVRKCLEKSPMDRFDSMDEVLAALSTLGPSLTTPVVTPVVTHETFPAAEAVAEPNSSPVSIRRYWPLALATLLVVAAGAYGWGRWNGASSDLTRTSKTEVQDTVKPPTVTSPEIGFEPLPLLAAPAVEPAELHHKLAEARDESHPVKPQPNLGSGRMKAGAAPVDKANKKAATAPNGSGKRVPAENQSASKPKQNTGKLTEEETVKTLESELKRPRL